MEMHVAAAGFVSRFEPAERITYAIGNRLPVWLGDVTELESTVQLFT